MSLNELLLLPENFLWAWRKVKRSYATTDMLFNRAELASFELSLEAELQSIRSDFSRGSYTLERLRLLPQPKKPDSEGRHRMRQSFEVSVRDQVAWTALINVLGPELDQLMPAWSYGSRLYRAAWYEDIKDGEQSRLNVGPYRHSSGYLYRHFKHSWPVFRRHISLTARRMVGGDIEEEGLDKGERFALDQRVGLEYLKKDFWRKSTSHSMLYSASMDLRKFYPSIHPRSILATLIRYVDGLSESPEIINLIERMIAFRIDSSNLSDAMRIASEPACLGPDLTGIPTGLFVGGFLANIAMIPVDHEVSLQLEEKRNVAHFRFVDDHEVLAYDFDSLCDWIREYEAILRRIDIGAEIEDDKFAPPELKWVVGKHSDAELPDSLDALREKAKKASAIDGRKPTRLMTRTLAQVSLLAATDFDLLTDAGQSQRMEQLEWLLLANIPDHEIRGETRAAFAAARISNLTPSLFKPNGRLLIAVRERERLKGKKSRDGLEQAQLDTLHNEVEGLSLEDERRWESLVDRNFGLLFEAFTTYPEKVRLFIRLIDYCRSTGCGGFTRIEGWLAEAESRELRDYLGAVAIHVISKHIITASAQCHPNEALHRENAASRKFLEHVTQINLELYIASSGPKITVQGFQLSALRSLLASALLAAADLSTVDPEISERLNALATKSNFGNRASLEMLARSTGTAIGVWHHWSLSVSRKSEYSVPTLWASIVGLHDVSNAHDWTNLRRYPAVIPESMWTYMRTHPDLLAEDDAGWLLDAAKGNPSAFATMEGGSGAADQVRRALSNSSDQITLIDWIAFINQLDPSDPRRSEWTALEIVRQILEPLLDIESVDLDVLDKLHPANILIPEAWKAVPHNEAHETLTWLRWRSIAAEHRVRVDASGLDDYRYEEVLWMENERAWPRRVRAIGQLAWGILRRSFQLPFSWNIRGQERSLVELVAWEVDRLPISSFSLSILRSCLLSRNRETSFMLMFPSIFGKRLGPVADDTGLDNPIASPQQLLGLIEDAQSLLTNLQMTILEHEPRQLIPVNLAQVGYFGASESNSDDLED
ncbi:MAG: RNA-directed DNA polymerase [Alphaproteobacteria bacterium]|nr:MAG: RNA-directed DNA polymerase [Alphaproteobacteria bacterium]